MKNSSYWQNRFEQLEEAQHTSNVRKYAEIQEQFNIAERTINNQINAWYGRFADANGVSISEARRMLDAKEMAELKWDVQQYIKYGQENALNDKWMRELESASARAHISRLEALRLRTQSECEKLYGNLTDDISDHIASQYEKAYYHTAFEVAKGTNRGANFAALDSKKVEKLIQKPWAADGKNFAIRLGENKANLIDSVYKNVVQMSLTGSGPDKAIESLSKVMNNDKVRASRIIMTESAYFGELAHRDTFRELGVEKYEIVATLDSRTSEICQEMDGKVFDMKVFEPGVTAPPFHPNCRSTTVPYYEDDYGDIGERAARDEDGNTYYVPDNITYKEWEKRYVSKKNGSDTAANIAANALLNKYGEEVVFNLEPKKPIEDTERAARREARVECVKDIITKLNGEYNSYLTEVTVGAEKAAGDMSVNGLMRLSSMAPDTVIHEFGHALASTDRVKLGLASEDEERFLKELTTIRTKYEKAYRADAGVSISFYSHSSKDEFLAEAFTHAKAKQLGIELEKYGTDYTYSNQVLDLVDKYFKKNTPNVLKSGSQNVYNITDSAINNVIKVGKGVDAEFIREQHVNVLKTAKENDSVEVAMLFDDDRKAISTVIGTATEVDLNVPGRTAAKYVMHNHPNNQSFSNKDVVWLLKNPNVRYFSIVKNNGKSEIIYLPENFDATKLKIEYKRLTKKYSKEIAQSKERGYNSVISDLLSKTKSNLIYWR